MNYHETTYGLSGREFEARCGAVATNAYYEILRAIGRSNKPILDLDFRKIEMIRRVLMNVNEVEFESEYGSVAAPVQAPVTKEFNEIESRLADALALVDATEDASTALVARKPKA